MLHQIGFIVWVKLPNEQSVTEILSKVTFSSWERLKTMKLFSHTNSQDEKKLKKQIKWTEVSETLFFQSCFIAARKISLGDGLKRKRLVQWASEPQQICVYYWLFQTSKANGVKDDGGAQTGMGNENEQIEDHAQ